MSLIEFARFSDVYEADLAAAFLESHGIPVHVTERHQTTIDPLMQRALGIRLMGAASNVEAARDLLARARAGEFATEEGDDLPRSPDAGTRTAATLLALLVTTGGGFWGASMPRRLRPVHVVGIAIIVLIGVSCIGWGWWLTRSIFSAPQPAEYAHW